MSRFCFSDRRRKNLKATILLLSCQFLLLAARGPHKTCISATVQLHQRSEFVIFQWKRQQQFISPSQLKAEIDLYKKTFTLLLRNQCEPDCDFFHKFWTGSFACDAKKYHNQSMDTGSREGWSTSRLTE